MPHALVVAIRADERRHLTSNIRWKVARWVTGLWFVVYLLHDPKGAAGFAKVAGAGLLNASWQVAEFMTTLTSQEGVDKVKGDHVSEGAREQVNALAGELGWRLEETQDVEGLMATWTLDVWLKGEGDAGDWSVVEVMWTDLGRGPVFKHGLYRSPRTGRRGQLKAVTGQGHRLYWSVEKALREA